VNNGIVVEESASLKSTPAPYNGFLDLGDGKICYVTYGGQNVDHDTEYVILNTETGESKEVSPFPHFLDDHAWGDLDKLFLYAKNSVVKPDKSRFASFYGRFKFFRIHDADGGIVKNVRVETEPRGERLIAYGTGFPKATDRYIFVFCTNRRENEPPADTTELQIWDWEGNPVVKYVLDRNLRCFAFSEKYKRLYATNQYDADRIYSYQIPEL
jgi:hypothetical protein